MSNSLRPHGLQHSMPPCPSPTPRVCPNSCPLSWWCHPTISSSVILFSSCPLPQHQSLFQWISSSHQVLKVLVFQLQHQSFQWIFRFDFFNDCLVWSLSCVSGNQPWILIGRINAEAEALILWPPDPKNWFIGKDSDAGNNWRQEEKGITEDKMIGWHHWLNGHKFEQTPGGSEGHGSLACCSSWGHRVRHNWVTKQQPPFHSL